MSVYTINFASLYTIVLLFNLLLILLDSRGHATSSSDKDEEDYGQRVKAVKQLIDDLGENSDIGVAIVDYCMRQLGFRDTWNLDTATECYRVIEIIDGVESVDTIDMIPVNQPLVDMIHNYYRIMVDLGDFPKRSDVTFCYTTRDF